MAKSFEEFVSVTEFAGGEIRRLAGDASARRYARISLGDKTARVMDTPADGENFPAFVRIAEGLLEAGYSTPKILAKDMENGFLLLEDFGDDSFTRLLSSPSPLEYELYETAIDLLVDWQTTGTFPPPLRGRVRVGGSNVVGDDNSELSLLLVPPTPPNPVRGEEGEGRYNTETYLREVSLFPDWFLPKILGAEKAADLREEYMQIWRDILQVTDLQQNIFVHRDFHADNLMWLPQREGVKKVGLLDFQDGLLGDPAYDMVSLLEDARRDVAPEFAQQMIKRYLQKTGADEQQFRSAYKVLGAQRNSKIIGIFVRLCVRDGKQNYLQFLPRVWTHLQHDLLTPLRIWLDKIVPQEFQR